MPGGIGIIRPQLMEHLNHHIVRGLINEGNEHLLSVDFEHIPLLFHGSLTDLPHKIPGQHLRQGEAQLLHIVLIYITGLRGAHEGQGILMSPKAAFRQKFRHNLPLGGGIEIHLFPAQTVTGIIEQVIQGNHHIFAGEVSCNVVGVGNTHVGCGARGDIGNNIVVNPAIVGV